MWEPLTDRVLVQPFTETTRPVGQRILLPDQNRERPHVGQVLTLGPKAVGVRAGDVVAFGKFAGVEVIISGQKRLIMRTEEILGRQGEADLALTRHEITEMVSNPLYPGKETRVVVATLVHEAEFYCRHCDPLQAEVDAETKRRLEDAPRSPLVVPAGVSD